uniref:C-type lectin domain-containing protein n=1 Tax=Esox lucius TaxID=8010 RepID=A0AAY5K3A8_ESOLU
MKSLKALAGQNILRVLWGLMAVASSVQGARVVSGQTLCERGAEHPCYKIAYFQDVAGRVAFDEARHACEMDGGSLLSVETAAEQRHIEYLLQELQASSTGTGKGSRGIADGDFWIGLSRTGDDNVPEQNGFTSCPDLYHWTDGSVSQFRNWYFDEPSCGGEACVVMYHQPTALHGLGGAYMYQWNDDRCNMKHNFICKFEPDVPGVQTEVVMQPGSSEEETPRVVIAGPSGMLLVYVIIPTIPLLLLILVASGTCCFQMFSKSKPRTKTSVNQSTLWISNTPKMDSMDV